MVQERKGRRAYLGMIGNGKTIALISHKASIEWLCLPHFDSRIYYSRALDPVNGQSMDLKLFEKNEELQLHKTSQNYIPNTNVLVTKLFYEGLDARVVDFMPWGEHYVTNYLVRLVRIKNVSKNSRTVSLRVESGIYSEQQKFNYLENNTVFYKDDELSIGITFQGNKTEDVLVQPGKEITIPVIIAYDSTPLKVEKMLEKKIDFEHEKIVAKNFWKNWLERGKIFSFENKKFQRMYHRSLLATKLLTFHPTGAVVASPTTSFPATVGGSENWDYRFCWIRDTYIVQKALLEAGHYSEVKKALQFLFSLQSKNGHWKYPFFTIDGNIPKDELIVEEIIGPNMEDTIRINNAAKDQLQLDSEGSVIDLLYRYHLFTHEKSFLRKYWKRVKKAADWIAKNYHKTENGIWEFRGETQHWIYGKVLCYAGLEAAMRIADVLGESRHPSWERAVRKIKRDIQAKGFSGQRNAFLQTYNSDSTVDPSVLAIEFYGILPSSHPKIRSTVKLIEKKLYVNGGIKRFEEAAAPFYLTTLWLAQHFILANDLKKARKYLTVCIDSTTDLYLVAEHFDPKNKKQLGNFPQTFCQSEFIIQLLNLKKPPFTLELPLKIIEGNKSAIMKIIERIQLLK